MLHDWFNCTDVSLEVQFVLWFYYWIWIWALFFKNQKQIQIYLMFNTKKKRRNPPPPQVDYKCIHRFGLSSSYFLSEFVFSKTCISGIVCMYFSEKSISKWNELKLKWKKLVFDQMYDSSGETKIPILFFKYQIIVTASGESKRGGGILLA